MEGQIRPTEETDHAGTDGADTGRISPSPLFTPGFLDTTGGTLQQRQTAFDRANQNLYAIIYLATDKAAALLVAMHAYDERGTRGDGICPRTSGEIPRHQADDLQGPRVRSAEDPGHYAPSLPGRLVTQQGQGQADRGTWRGHVSGVSP